MILTYNIELLLIVHDEINMDTSKNRCVCIGVAILMADYRSA